MTFLDMLRDATARNDSMLCVGLDPEPQRFPHALRGDAQRIYDFCAAIVDATCDLVCAFKPQIAYFAAHRAEDQLEHLLAHIRVAAPHVPIILDAKADAQAVAPTPVRRLCGRVLRHERHVREQAEGAIRQRAPLREGGCDVTRPHQVASGCAWVWVR